MVSEEKAAATPAAVVTAGAEGNSAMERIRLEPRTDWQRKVEDTGFCCHTAKGVPYWNEAAAYVFSAGEVDFLEAAANRLQELAIAGVEHCIAKDRFRELGIGERAKSLILASWNNPAFDEISLYGRFDLAYDGRGGEPKLLEYNADTPTSLLEAAVVQWHWLKDVFPREEQWNSIHERLIARWKEFKRHGRVRQIYLGCARHALEDYENTLYIADCAMQAGIKVSEILGMDQIGWNGRNFTDLRERKIEALFKLYPWEWLLTDPFGAHVEAMRVIEPAWKMIFSTKAILPILWEIAPNHPNLLEASFQKFNEGAYAAKPYLSREGSNVTIVEEDGAAYETGGPYGAGPKVFQRLADVPEFDGQRPVLGVWVIGEEAAGLGIREDESAVTGNLSRFVPHYFPKS